MIWNRRTRLLLLIASLLVVATPTLGQQVSSLPTAEAAEFLGDWTLAMELQGNPTQMTLSLTDAGGMLAATLSSARRPEPQAIVDVSREDDKLRLQWQRDFNGQPMTLVMDLQQADGGLTGTFGDETGFFSTTVQGSKGGGTEGADEAADDAESPRGSRRADGETSLTLAGNDIEIAFEKLGQEKHAGDWQALEQLGEGEVFRFVGGRAIKILTDADLGFGETVVKAHNVHPDYPGVYSIWLKKKSGDDWALVFNSDADIWGTQRLPEADVAEVPVTRTDADEPTDTFQVELVEAGEKAGLLRLAWGGHQWIAPFEIAE